MNNDFTKKERESVLIVDDITENLDVLYGILKDKYTIKAASNGKRALEIAQGKQPPDLILLDIMMPEMDGYTVCQKLKADPLTKDIPVIFITAKDQVTDEQKGFELGAADYITKPIKPAIVLARTATHIALFKQKQNLEREVRLRTIELSQTQDVTILSLSTLAEFRDNETGSHILRTQAYVRTLARELQKDPKYKDILTDEAIELLYKSAPLHDIGKVGIPDRILLKPGPLTDEEWVIMKTHTSLGKEAISIAENKLRRVGISFLRFASEIAYSHHEKWDGSGYPLGLKGDEIPISGRLMALGDVFDALISKRVYKKAFSVDDAIQIIHKGKGSHFDPQIIDAFDTVLSDFLQIAETYSEENS